MPARARSLRFRALSMRARADRNAISRSIDANSRPIGSIADRAAAQATKDTAAALACDECRCEMHRGRQSNGQLLPVLVVWVVHFAKKIDQPPTLGLKAPWFLQERCAAVSREPGVVHAPELRCGVRGRPPGVYQLAPRVYQPLSNI